MPMPYYVPPEQLMKDKADYARKGIARGKSILALEYVDGIFFIAENPSATLYKISEIYDRIAFAGVGKFNEFEQLRIGGIRLVDLKGYSYSREDVTAKSLANAYSQSLGNIFTSEVKPYECEILVASVGDTTNENELFHILYDGSVTDRQGWVAMGGQSDQLGSALEERYPDGPPDLKDAFRLGEEILQTVENRSMPPANLEVAILDRTRGRRKFRRLSVAQIEAILA
ncbi:MAG: proteasome subunit alpha [Actinobacteria bacterium]|nr:proteasome subunit alpha [Actinomycetota bacterium]MDQ3532193.1 proteasome subunit alpha [Actinomycetota bacterium]